MNISKVLSTASLGALLTISIAGSAGATSTDTILSQKQKDFYYKQYATIIKNINMSNPGTNLELVSKKDFKKDEWVTPKRFQAIAKQRVNINFTPTFDLSMKMSADASTKTKTIKSNGKSIGIAITGNFDTEYRSSAKRQVFSGINSVTSKSTSSKGTWKQTGYSADLIDAAKTYDITVGGKYTLNGVTSSHNIPIEFYCDTSGGVS